jgi:hypothetical protein
VRIFLLGGYDLEMVEIKKLLQKSNQKFYDKHLSWGAKLSDYADVLNDSDEFVAIELELDTNLPKHFIEIDHHNQNSSNPSSLEQVAKLLGVELDRYQKLVAANDRGYIPEMKKLCVTEEEIQEIRAKDRVAQGVTDNDEELAQKSIDEAKDEFIYSYSDKFSPISDRVWDTYSQYLIYNNKKILFYGYDLKSILSFLKQNGINQDDIYYGGGDNGFVGIKDSSLTYDDIQKLVGKFQMQKNKEDNLYSYHTFMFPFIFDGEFIPKDDWDYQIFEIKETKDYNEYIYFYKHVQDALYNLSDEEKNKKFTSKYYEYHLQDGLYIINAKGQKYELQLDGLSLRIFNNNVAILAFNLKNTKYFQPDDVLKINDFGRRIYPQFLSKENFTKTTKDAFLAECITLKFDDNEEIVEDFSYFDNIDNLQPKQIHLPKFITKLLKNSFDITKVRHIIDDRMFVISQYNNDGLVSKLQQYDDENGYIYENDDFWYRYIFVDGGEKTCQSRYMTKQFIKESTYDRWVEWGTLFGVSRYSFVALTGSSYGKNILLPHMQTMYFQMFSLLLAYRATIIKFSDEIQDITSQSDGISSKTRRLYKKYLNFLNKLYFKEITAQDQGIELYNQALKIMDIDRYMQNLDNEINELHSYTDMIENEKETKQMNTLTWIGAILLPPSIVTGFLGMNTLSGLGKYAWFDKSQSGFWALGAVIVSAMIIPAYFGIKKFWKGNK